jgi:glyoxylase-like metal-dependent hydrolase (beta-lactamase superfamily II)
MGVLELIVDTVTELPEPYTQFQAPVSIDRELVEGDIIDVSIKLEVVHTPGHSPGSVCFLAPDLNVAFTSDHVLLEITPHPLLTLAPDTETKRTRSLPTYVASLRKLLSVDIAVGYAGHRAPIPDLHARVHETIEHHHDRTETIAAILADTEPTTAYQLMHELFPDLPAAEMFPGMSEVIGHLDLLEDEGRVEITDGAAVHRYQRS